MLLHQYNRFVGQWKGNSIHLRPSTTLSTRSPTSGGLASDAKRRQWNRNDDRRRRRRTAFLRVLLLGSKIWSLIFCFFRASLVRRSCRPNLIEPNRRSCRNESFPWQRCIKVFHSTSISTISFRSSYIWHPVIFPRQRRIKMFHSTSISTTLFRFSWTRQPCTEVFHSTSTSTTLFRFSWIWT